MNDQRIAVITDSGTDTPASLQTEHDVRVVPLRINYSDGTSFESGVDIDADEVVRRLDEEIPSTSLPSPDQLRQALQTARDDGYEHAVIVTIASALSATNQTAQLVADQMADVIPTLVVDTRSIGMVAGMVVERCVDYVEAGVPFEELAERLDRAAEESDVFFAVKSLEYLYKGGRIGKAIYRLGTALNIKPVLMCDKEGYYTIAKKARGWDRSLDTMIAVAAATAKRYESVRLGICCSSATSPLYKPLEERLRAAIDNIASVQVKDISADLIVHTGPDLVGIGVQNAAL